MAPEKQRPDLLKRYRWFMRVLGALYILATLVFFFFPEEFLYLVNVGPKVFKITEASPSPADRFWTILSAGLMATLAALSFLASESPRIRGYGLAHLLAKVFTMAGFIFLVLNGDPVYFVYFVALAVEALLACAIAWSQLWVQGKPEA